MRLLLRRKQPEVKVTALNYLKQSGNKLDFPAILENTKHPLREVRQAALSTTVALCGETAMDVVEASLRDPHPEVQAEAAIGLIEIGNLNGLLTGFAVLKTMIESDNTADRSAAVLPLSRIQIAGKTTLFLKFLNDTDKEVRSAALQSCIVRYKRFKNVIVFSQTVDYKRVRGIANTQFYPSKCICIIHYQINRIDVRIR